MTESQALPKVTPYLLRRAESMCARRLAREYEGGDRSHDPVHRSRMRDAFLAAARDAHAELRVPVTADFAALGAELEPEERAVLNQAARWYVQVFGDRAARWEDLGLDSPTPSPRRRVRIGGWVDLPVITGDGGFELRQLDLWGGRVPFDDPLDLEAVRVAVLRLARWVGDASLRLVWVDLVHGLVRERVVDAGTDRPTLATWFDERTAIVRERASEPVATMGADCGTCNFVAACPVHPTGAHYGRKRDVLPGILTVTPTGLDTWRRCAREWRDTYLYGIPSSDTHPGTVHGQQMHDVLRVVHEQGSCRDDVHVDDVLVTHGFDANDRMRGELARHRTRCPDPAEALGHEVTRARFLRHASAPFMATARFDALWVYDGVLDARDYKTGQVWSDRVADDAAGAPAGVGPRAAGRPARAPSADRVRAPRRRRRRRSRAVRTRRRRSARDRRGAPPRGRIHPGGDDVRGRRRRRRVPPLPLPVDLPGLGGAGGAHVAGGRGRGSGGTVARLTP